jgi:hypothetical protein
MGPSSWIDRIKKRCNNVYRTAAGENMSDNSETGEDWKMTNCYNRPQNMTSVTCMILIRHTYFSVYSLAKFLLFSVTPAMVVHDVSIIQSYALTEQAATEEKQ